MSDYEVALEEDAELSVDDAGDYNRLTINFDPNTAMRFLKGRDDNEMRAYRNSIDIGKWEFDRRNNIFCCTDGYSVQTYKNYLLYLNSEYIYWKSYGLFDLGMVPYLMLPSFMMNCKIAKGLQDIATQFNKQVIRYSGHGLLSGRRLVGDDLWMFREDLVELIQICDEIKNGSTSFSKSADNVSVIDLLNVLYAQ